MSATPEHARAAATAAIEVLDRHRSAEWTRIVESHGRCVDGLCGMRFDFCVDGAEPCCGNCSHPLLASATPEDDGLSEAIFEGWSANYGSEMRLREMAQIAADVVAARAAAPDEVGGDPCGGLAPGDESGSTFAASGRLPGSADAERRIAAAAAPDALRERVEALAALAHEAVSAVGGSHSHWREGGAGGRCRTCEDANERQDALRARLRALLDDPALAGRPTGGAT